MPILVHLADEKDSASIKKNGIKPGKYRTGIFCMPVLPSFYISHQWLRELKRSGAKTFVGIYFRLDSKAMVYAGKYNTPHRQITLGEAIREIMDMKDPLGYEIILERKITAKEIQKIRKLSQKTGWRYYPHSHGKTPGCACPICIPPGSMKGRKLREKIEPPMKSLSYDEILKRLREESDEDEIENLLSMIGRRKRKSDPAELLFLLDRKSVNIDQSLAIALSSFRHRNTKEVLFHFIKSPDRDTCEFATESLLEIYGSEVEKTLLAIKDPVVKAALHAWKKSGN